jgi:hypothetical protein
VARGAAALIFQVIARPPSGLRRRRQRTKLAPLASSTAPVMLAGA